MNENNYISKGQYQYHQQSGLVTVKDYIFMENSGKKCLLLRLANDTGTKYDSIRFKLIEKDPGGSVIKTTVVEWKNMELAPSTTYSSSEAIVVDDLCVDFKVEIEYLIAGQYKYSIGASGVEVDYIPMNDTVDDVEDKAEAIAERSVKKKNFGKPKFASLIVCAAVFFIIAIALVAALSGRANNNKDVPEIDTGYKIEYTTAMGVYIPEGGQFVVNEEMTIIYSSSSDLIGSIIGSYEVYTGSDINNYEFYTTEDGMTYIKIEGIEGKEEYQTVGNGNFDPEIEETNRG